MPSTRCSLNTSATSVTNPAASPRNVTMCCDPHHQLDHLLAVPVLRGHRDADETEQQLGEQQQQHDHVHRPAGEADARLGEAAMDQQDQTDEANAAGDPAGDHGQHLLRGRRHAEDVPDAERRHQSEQVAEEDAEDAEVEEVRAPAQLPGAEQLRRIALPRVLIAVEAQQAAREEHGQRDVGIDAEQEHVEKGHRVTPSLRQGRRGTMCTTDVCGWLAPHPAPPGGPKMHRLLDPFVVERGIVRDRPGLATRRKAGLAHHGENRGRDGGVAAVPVGERLSDRAHDVRAIAEHVARLGIARERQVLEHHRQVIRKLVDRRPEARLRIQRLQLHHRLAAGPRIAVHVLEEMQRRRAARDRTARRSFPARRGDRSAPSHATRAASALAPRPGRAAARGRRRRRCRAARRRDPPTDTRGARRAPCR